MMLTHVTQHQHHLLREKHRAETANFVLRICNICNGNEKKGKEKES